MEESKSKMMQTVTRDGGEPKKKKVKKKVSLKKRLMRISAILELLIVLYLTVAYSDIPFIEKWRTIYIETAMSTNSHQWLATWFFPKRVIDEVMARKQKELEKQIELVSEWETEEIDDRGREDFFKDYWELDDLSVHDYFESHSDVMENGYDSILIEDFEGKLGLKTVNGDSVVVLDTENNLLIVAVKGNDYQGKLAIVKNPEQVDLVKAASFGSFGELADSYAKRCDAAVVVNASAFVDVDGVGTGAEVKGSLVIDGTEYGHPVGGLWKFVGFKENNRMYITNYSSDIVSDYRWAIEFSPALIVDGVSVVEGTYGLGIQPRTAIGQAQNGDFMMLIVDGRQVGYSLGCTVVDCADILKNYHAYQAMNLDGGSSSVMWYKDRQITSSSSVAGNGRYMPDAIVVQRADK